MGNFSRVHSWPFGDQAVSDPLRSFNHAKDARDKRIAFLSLERILPDNHYVLLLG